MTEEIKNEIESIEYFIEKSPKTDDYTLALKKEGKKKYILSKYKPREYAIEQLGEDWGNKQTVWILIGFGFGYMTEAILNKVGQNTTIVIIEPNQKLLEEQLKLCPIKDWPKTIHFIKEIEPVIIQDQLENIITKSEMYNFKIHILENYVTYYSLFCQQIKDILANTKSTLEIGYYTALYHNAKNTLNTLKNIRFISENYDLLQLKKYCKDSPALIVSAGPSLDKNINEIKNFKGVVIAIGRTMAPLFEHGICPDFVISVDPIDVVYDTFGDYKEHNVPLITIVEGNSRVVAGSHKEKYFMQGPSSGSIIIELFKLQLNPQLDMFNTVASVALSFAQEMECSPIVFVGQDLAFTENKHHVGDKEEIQTQEMLPIQMIKGYYGGEVPSCEGYITMIKWFEAQIKKYPELIYINATEGGAYIEGMLHKPLHEVIKTYCIKEKPEIVHKKLEQPDIDYEKQMQLLKKNLTKLQGLTKNMASYYKRIRIEHNRNHHQSKLNQLYKQISLLSKEIDHIPNSGLLINWMLTQVESAIEVDGNYKEQIGETEEESNMRLIELQIERYESLAKNCIDFKRMIDMALEEV